MAEISWPRRSYEADVLLIPLDPHARAWLDARADADVEGITIADRQLPSAQQAIAAEPVPAADRDRGVSGPLDTAVHDADVVVLFTHDLTAIDRDAVVQVGDASRLSGTLLGAVVVSPGASWDDPTAHRSMITIRESSDNVVILKDDRFVLAFLQVLRGGARDARPKSELEVPT